MLVRTNPATTAASVALKGNEVNTDQIDLGAFCPMGFATANGHYNNGKGWWDPIFKRIAFRRIAETIMAADYSIPNSVSA